MALLFNPFSRRKIFARADARHDCCIDGEIVLTEKMVSYEGRLINLSRGGAMFRPRLAYLMHRRGDAVQVSAAGLALAGEIVATTPLGFGVRFERPLSDPELAHLLAPKAAETVAA
jgi:PilZ domain